MKLLLTTLLTLFMFFKSIAGNDLELILKGKVIDKNHKETLAGVAITDHEGKILAYSTLDGFFELKINIEKTPYINFSYPSYKVLQIPSNVIFSGALSVELEEY